MKPRVPSRPCPCTPTVEYDACCGRYHAGAPAPTAEALMRSRYSAYVLQRFEYVHTTWHIRTCPDRAALALAGPRQWLGLSVRAAGEVGDTGTVEFVARYKIDGRAHRMHEVSRFERVGGRWYYIDGVTDLT